MSQPIDNRIVRMQFQNQQFESGIKSSMGFLDKLKQSLNFTGAIRNVSNLNKEVNNICFNTLAKSIETIEGRFTTLGVIGTTALVNITNAALNAGKQMVKSLTIDPVATGFNEYELKMNSIQTIMAGSGESLQVVTQYLNELNEYSDKTIYSFQDMTSNIGKFTNAGVGLGDAVSAIQGVANVAAISGANAGEAARSMYNFAQALAAGHIRAIDWRSIELANMATVEFKQQLIDSAVAMGTLQDAGGGMYKTVSGQLMNATRNFNETLTEQWMTSDVLVKTLGRYADETTDIGKRASAAAQEIKTYSQMIGVLRESAQSGWAQTWEILIGNFNEARILFTELDRVIGGFIRSSADARNLLLQGWKDLGGRAVIMDAFGNVLLGLEKIIAPISKAFRDIFPPMTAETLFKITQTIQKFTERLIISDKTSENLRRTFRGLFSILRIGQHIFSSVINVVAGIFGVFQGSGKGISDFTANIGDFIVELEKTIQVSGIFTNITERIVNTFRFFAVSVGSAISAILVYFNSLGTTELTGLDKFSDGINTRFGFLIRILEFFKNSINQVVIFFKDKVEPVFKMIGNRIQSTFAYARGHVERGVENLNIVDILTTGLFAALIMGIRKLVGVITDIGSTVAGFKDSIIDVLDGVKSSLMAYQNNLKAGILKKIAIAIGILTVSLVVLTFIDSAKLESALTMMGALFLKLLFAMGIFSKFAGGAGGVSLLKVSTAMVGLSLAILILSFALKRLTEFELKSFDGFLAVGILLYTLAIFLKMTKGLSGLMMKHGFSIMLIGVALHIMVEAIKKFENIDISTIYKGLLGIGGVLLLISTFSFVMKKLNIQKIVSGLVLFGMAFLLITIAIERIAVLPTDQLYTSLKIFAIILGTLAIFALLSQKFNFIKAAIGISLFGVALNILIHSLENLSKIPLESFLKSIGYLASLLIILSLGFHAMPNMEKIGINILLISGALYILAKVLTTLGKLSLEQVGIGLLAIAGVLLILGLFAKIMVPLAPALLKFSLALGLFTLSLLVLSVSIKVVVVALALLAGIGAAAAAAILLVGGAILSLLPLLFTKLGEGLISLAKILTEAMPIITDFLKALGLGLIKVLEEILPPLIVVILNFLKQLLIDITKIFPDIMKTGVELIVTFIKGITEGLPKIIEVAVLLIENFIRTIIEQLGNIINTAVEVIITFINSLTETIRNNREALTNASINLVWVIIESIFMAFGILGKRVWDSLVYVFERAVAAVKNFLGIKSPSSVFAEIARDIIDGIIKGFRNGIRFVRDAAVNLGRNIVNSVTNFLGINSPSKEFAKIGRNIADGLSLGIDQNAGGPANSAKNMINNLQKGVFNQLADFRNFEQRGLSRFEQEEIERAKRKAQREKELAEQKAHNQQQATTQEAAANRRSTAGSRQTAKTQIEIERERISDLKRTRDISTLEEIQTWERLQKMYKIGSRERREVDIELFEARERLRQEDFNRSKEWISTQKRLDELTALEEVQAWERIQARFIQGTDERKEADLELFDARKRLRQEEFNHSRNWINEQREMNKISMVEEVRAWERVQKRYIDGTEERKEADKEVFNARKRLADEQRRLLDRINETEQRYTDAVRDRSRAIADSFGLFDEIEKREEEVKGEVLKQNLRDQVEEMRDWAMNLEILATKGIDEGLLEKLKEMGPSANSELRALVNMTDAELTTYSNLFRQKNEIAKTRAIAELRSLRQETNIEISEISQELNKLGISAPVLKESDKKAFETIGKEAMSYIVKGYEEESKEILTMTEEVNVSITQEFKDSQGKYKEAGKTLIQALIDGFNYKQDEVIKTIKINVESILKEISNFNSYFYNTGQEVINGFINGMISKNDDLIQTSRFLASTSYSTMAKELGVKSPSKEFAKLGQFSIFGFVKGLDKYFYIVEDTITQSCDDILITFNRTLQKIYDIFKFDTDMRPTIRPVIDMTDVERGLQSTFHKQHQLNISSAIFKASEVSTNRKYGNYPDSPINQTNNMDNTKIQITNHYTVRDDTDIRKISRDLKTVLDRYSYAKGVVT